MSLPPGHDQNRQVIPFPERNRGSTAHETYFDQLQQNLLNVAREALVTADDDEVREHDRFVINDERAFRMRFGFDWPHRYRKGLIQLKHTQDLTDREIRLLKLTGSLRADARGVQLAASRPMAVYGRALMVLLGLLMLRAWFLANAHQSPFSSLLVWKLVAVMAGLLGLGWLAYQFYIRPWKIQQRAQAVWPVKRR